MGKKRSVENVSQFLRKNVYTKNTTIKSGKEILSTALHRSPVGIVIKILIFNIEVLCLLTLD